ncbi:MAG: helix-turn-helix transcriptional regulator [Clostridia bacterium]|nr:helix-turn-helix transcriptional regulator [Clostridia bacterium]
MKELKSAYLKHQINNIISIHKIVTLNYFEFTNDFSYKREKHNFWELVYVDKGKLTVETDDETFTLNQGECVFHKPNEVHCHKANGVNAPNYFVICFVCNSSYMNVFRNKHFNLPERLKRFISNIITEAQQVFDLPLNNPEEQVLRVAPEELLGGQQMIRTYLEQFLILLLRREYGEANSLPDDAKEENHLASQLRRTLDMYIYQDFSVEKFCSQMKYSKAYLSKIFLSQYGQTIHGYVTYAKIKEARALIREHTYNFTQISDMLCFSNPLYFSRVFKKITGMSPSEYKKSIKQD